MALGALEKTDGSIGPARHGYGHATTSKVDASCTRHGLSRFVEWQRTKRHALATRHDGGQDGIGRGAQQDKRHRLGRLLDSFEQGVCRICTHLLCAVDDIDLMFGANRGQGNILQQLARLTDEIARGTLGSVIVHVRMRATRRTHAVITSPAPAILAQKSLSKRPCSLELTRTGSAYKQIGVSGSAAFHRTCQKALDALLTR